MSRAVGEDGHQSSAHVTGIAHDLTDHTLKSEPKLEQDARQGFVSSVRDNESICNMTWNVIGNVINSSRSFQGDVQATFSTEALDPKYSDEISEGALYIMFENHVRS